MDSLKAVAPPLFFALLLLTTGAVEGQQIYKWTDAEGRVHYGTKKPENANQSQMLDIAPTATAPTNAADSAAEVARINALAERMASERRSVEDARQEQALRELEQENEQLKNDLLKQQKQQEEDNARKVIVYPLPGFYPPYGPYPPKPQRPAPYPCYPWPECQQPAPPTALPEPTRPPNKPDRAVFNPKPVGMSQMPNKEGFRPQ